MKNDDLDLEAVQTVLSNSPFVVDYTLVERRTSSGHRHTIIYVVPGARFSQETLERQLAPLGTDATSRLSVVTLSCAPRNDAGEWDLSVLTACPVLTESAIAQAENIAAALPGIEKVAALVESKDLPSRLHLADLLPDYPRLDPESSERREQEPTLSPAAQQRGDSVVQTPALSQGADLTTGQDVPVNLVQMLLTASRGGSRDSLVFHHADGTMTVTGYADLLDRALKVTKGLRTAGLNPGSPVILQLGDNWDFLTGFWGCVLGGYAPVPMALLVDAGLDTLERFAGVWRSLNSAPVLSSGKFADFLRQGLKTLERDGLRLVDMAPLLQQEHGATDAVLCSPDPDDIALIMLTSGSTGLPKGVPLSHRNLIARSVASVQMHGFDESLVSLNWMPLDHVSGIIYFHLRDVYLGCKQVHVQTEVVAAKPTRWLDLIHQHRVNVTFAPNFAFGLVAKEEDDIARADWDLSSIQLLLNGGESIVAATARKFLSLLGRFGLSSEVMCPAWGMSEISSGVTYATNFSLESTSDDDVYVEVGYPIPGVSLRIVDEQDQLLAEGEVGRLQVRGATVFKGYYQREDSVNEVFTEDGWFRTGDLGRLRNGSLTITGREKDIIIINGVNYAGPRIESSVEKVGGVLPSFTAAIAVPDIRGDGSECLAIFYAPINRDDRSLKSQIKLIKDQVFRDEGIVPSYFLPLLPEDLPKTSIGKIQRPQLLKDFISGEFEDTLRRVELLIGSSATIPAWFFGTQWQAKSLKEKAAEEPVGIGPVVVFSSPEDTVAEALLSALQQAGVRTVRVIWGKVFHRLGRDVYELDPGSQEDYRSLYRDLAEQGVRPASVCYLHVPDGHTAGPEGFESTLSICSRFIAGNRALLEAIAGQESAVKMLVINRYWAVTEPAVSNKAGEVFAAPLTGLIKALGMESTEVICASIDLGDLDRAMAAEQIIKELIAGVEDAEVAYREGARLVPLLRQSPLEARPAAANLKPEGCYLVSGGLGGIGLTLASYLLKQFGARVIVTGREKLRPGSERESAFRQLEKLPGSIAYIASDLRDASVLIRALKDATGSAKLAFDGIFHLAGAYHESPVLEETRETLAQTFAPKIMGALTLLAVLEENPAGFFVGFSSVSSFFGGATVGGYAAANLFLDQLANRQAGSARIYSINWATWRDTGISRQFALKEPLLASGYMEMPVEQALRSLQVVLANPPGQYLVGLDINNPNILTHLNTAFPLQELRCYCELDAESDFLPETRVIVQDDFGAELPVDLVVVPQLPVTDEGVVDREALAALFSEQLSPVTPPSTATEKSLAAVWQQILGIGEVSVDWSFFELGGQSLLATQLNSKLNKQFGLNWSLRNIFEYPTIREQAHRIDEISRLEIPAQQQEDVGPSEEKNLPLSSSQKRMWFMDRFSPTRHMYNISASLRVVGKVDISRLVESLRVVINRQEALRTVFPTIDGQPVQKILSSIALDVPVRNVEHLMDEERVAKIREIEGVEARTNFDLENGPLIRAVLVCTGCDEYLLMVTMHHIISDGWSLQVFFSDLFNSYQVLGHKNGLALNALKFQYSDYARWHNEWLKSEEFAGKCQYWIEKLQGVENGFELPTDRPRPPVQSFRGARYISWIPSSLIQRLEAFGKQHNASLYMVMLTAYEVLLYRRARQDDIVIGTVTANRNRSELNEIIGFFVNVFVLRTSLNEKLGFSEALAEVRKTALEAYDYMDVPFEVLVERLHTSRDLSRAPIFQIAFDLRESFLTRSPVPGIELGLMEPDLDVSIYDLHLTLEHREHGLKAIWEYATDLFEEETIQQLSEQYLVLLEQLLLDAACPLAQIPLMSGEGVQQQIVSSRGRERPDYLVSNSVVPLVEARAMEQPDHVAVEYYDQRLSYRQLIEKSDLLAGYLGKQGIGDGSMVAISVDSGLEMVIAILGVLKCGAAYVPVDPQFPLDRKEYILDRIKAPVVLTQSHYAEGTLPLGWPILALDSDWGEVERSGGFRTPIVLQPRQLAYSIFTSGSTGQPKGVLLEHQALLNLTLSQIEGFQISSSSRVLQFASFGFDASVSEIFTALVAGATLCMARRSDLLPGAGFVKFLQDQRISVITLPPSVLRVMPSAQLPNLKTLVSAGEACSVDLVERWADSRLFINAYGPTETTVCATLGEVRPDATGRAPDIGLPLSNMAVYLLDDALHPVPNGIVGELCVAGAGVARGYLGLPELTAEKFVDNPLDDGIYGRMYRTGDLGIRRSNGRIDYVGRRDDQIKLRGFRIELGEIEHALRTCPGVHDAVAILREDTPGDPKLVTYIVSEGTRTETALGAGLPESGQQKLELWPSIAEFFVYDELIYYAMTHDEIRNRSYKVAINKLVKDKVILDIGTGRDAILTRFCVEAGAKKVYAIELLEESYRAAMQTIEKLGIQDRVELIHGDATKVVLPEKIDVCVSEIVGAIGGSEGSAAIINNAWRFMKDTGQMIPSRSTTLIAGVSLPTELVERPRFSELTGHYVRQIFEQVGYKFDLRLSLRHLSRENLVTTEDVFEDLDYSRQIDLESAHDIRLEIKKDGLINGFLVWLTLETIAGESFDILDNEFCWLPVFLPVFEPAVVIAKGDTIEARVTRTLCENGLNPDFNVCGVVRRQNGEVTGFDYSSYHNRKVYRHSPFYQRLFEGDLINVEAAESAQVRRERVKSYLAQKLPNYMQPNFIEILDGLPLTSNGKIDRKNLPPPSTPVLSLMPGGESSATALEQVLAEVWKHVLNLHSIDIDQNFFDIGGDSLKMAEAQYGILTKTGTNVDLVELFQYPTVRLLARHLENRIHSQPSDSQEEAETALRSQASGKERMRELAKRQSRIKDNTRKPA